MSISQPFLSVHSLETLNLDRVPCQCITLTRDTVLCQCLFKWACIRHPFVEPIRATEIAFQYNAQFVTERFHVLSRQPAITRKYGCTRISATGGKQTYKQCCWHPGSIFRNLDPGLEKGHVSAQQNVLNCPSRTRTRSLRIPRWYRDGDGQGSDATTATQRNHVHGIVLPDTRNRHSAGKRKPGRQPGQQRRVPGNPIENRRPAAIAWSYEHPPPSNDAGNDTCVMWWTRVGSFPTSDRNTTHRPFASPAERSRLLAYMKEHLQAPAAAT